MSQDTSASTELDRINEINARPLPGRILGYIGQSGPGFLQGAMTALAYTTWIKLGAFLS